MSKKSGLKTGGIYSFKKKGSVFPVRGELRDAYILDGKKYIVLYLLYSRKEKVFILDGKGSVREELNDADKQAEIVYGDLKEAAERPVAAFIKKTVGIAVLISFIFTINPHFRLPSPNIGYDEFLKKDLTLHQLYNAVTSRLRYVYDRDEEWTPPRKAWASGYGDCEEFAAVISDYLTVRGIENYLTGLEVKDRRSGHAVVFAKKDGSFYMLDPTKAVERLGIARLDKARTINEAVKLYSSKPAVLYKVPQNDGAKEMIKLIY